jgi:AcrR family transcriptional regulator
MPAKKQISKEMILSASMELLMQDGMDAVNVKRIAKKLNCSTQPIYLSFENMDALRSELSAKVIEKFVSDMNKDGTPDLFGMYYIRFAKKEKNLFRYIFMRENAFEELRPVLDPMIEASTKRLMEEYSISKEDALYFHDQLWMQAHGIASMIATDYCNWNLEKVERMLAQCKADMGRRYEE